MIVKIKKEASNCDYNDQGMFVDAVVNPNEGAYPGAIYIDRNGLVWNLDDDEFIITPFQTLDMANNQFFEQ